MKGDIASCKKEKKKRFVLLNQSSWERPRPTSEAHLNVAHLPGLQIFSPFSIHRANAQKDLSDCSSVASTFTTAVRLSRELGKQQNIVDDDTAYAQVTMTSWQQGKSLQSAA